MTDTPTRTRLLVFAAVVALALAAAAGGVQAADDLPTTNEDETLTLEVVDETDETVSVELSSPATDVAGFQANLSYAADAEVDDVEFGDVGGVNEKNVDPDAGYAFLTESNAPGESVDEPTLATITFAVDGDLEDLELHEDDSLVSDGDGDVITERPDDGDDGDGGSSPSAGGGGGGTGGGDAGSDDDNETNDSADDETDESNDETDETNDEPDESDGETDESDDGTDEADGSEDENDDAAASVESASDDGDESDSLPGFTAVGAIGAALIGLLVLGAVRRG